MRNTITKRRDNEPLAFEYGIGRPRISLFIRGTFEDQQKINLLIVYYCHHQLSEFE